MKIAAEGMAIADANVLHVFRFPVDDTVLFLAQIGGIVGLQVWLGAAGCRLTPCAPAGRVVEGDWINHDQVCRLLLIEVREVTGQPAAEGMAGYDHLGNAEMFENGVDVRGVQADIVRNKGLGGFAPAQSVDGNGAIACLREGAHGLFPVPAVITGAVFVKIAQTERFATVVLRLQAGHND